MDTLSKQEAAELLHISIRELNRRVEAGELEGPPSTTRFHRGKPIIEILVSSLPTETQSAWAGRPYLTQSPELTTTAIQTLHGSPSLMPSPLAAGDSKFKIQDSRAGETPALRRALQPARRELLIGTGSTEPQMVLNFDRKDAFRLLDPDLADWAWRWFERLREAGLLCLIDNDSVIRNGGWKKFKGQELRVQVSGARCQVPGEGKVFHITNKEDVVEWVAASFDVSPAFIWERCREIEEFFSYLIGQKRKQQPIDLDLVRQIFPARAKDSGGRFRPRADAGISKTIPQAAAEFLLARYGAGSRPGTDGWRPSFALVLNEYETLRQAIIDAGENPDEHGYPEISIYAVRRLLPSAETKSDPGLVLAREGSAALRAKAVPYIPGDKTNLFTHDCWVGDHRTTNVWVRWSKDPSVIYRPYGTWTADFRCQYPISVVVCVIPSSITIFRGLKIGFLNFQTAPRVFLCDNGKDYRAMLLSGSGPIPKESNDAFDGRQAGLLERFGIECRHALPSHRSKSTGEQECHARSKSVIEGWFGAWLDTFDRQQPGACGQDPFDKPDKVYVELARRDDLLLDVEYERRLVAYVNDRIVNHPNRGLKGLTPAEALQRYSRAAWGLDERQLLPEQIGEMALVRDQRTVKNSMITIKVGGEERKYEHSAFFSLSGQDVDIAYDPTEPDDVFIYYNGRALGRAAEVGRTRRDFFALPGGVVSESVSQGMRKQRIATRSAREMLLRREQAAGWVPSQGDMTAFRERMIQKRMIDAPALPQVAHAASIEKVRAQSERKAHPEIGSVEYMATGGRQTQRRMTADDLAKAFLKEEEEDGLKS